MLQRPGDPLNDMVMSGRSPNALAVKSCRQRYHSFGPEFANLPGADPLDCAEWPDLCDNEEALAMDRDFAAAFEHLGCEGGSGEPGEGPAPPPSQAAPRSGVAPQACTRRVAPPASRRDPSQRQRRFPHWRPAAHRPNVRHGPLVPAIRVHAVPAPQPQELQLDCGLHR